VVVITRSTYTTQGRKTLGATPADDGQSNEGRTWAIEYRDDPEADGEHDRDGTVMEGETEGGQSK